MVWLLLFKICRIVAEPRHQSELPLRVLFADDDADTAETSRWLLERAGHHVEVASDGLGAVALARSFRPSIAMLDISMPGLTGFEAAMQIRTILPEVKLVAISGWPMSGREAELKQMGFDHHAQKPVDVAKLCAHLSSVVEQSRPCRTTARPLVGPYAANRAF